METLRHPDQQGQDFCSHVLVLSSLEKRKIRSSPFRRRSFAAFEVLFYVVYPNLVAHKLRS